MFAMNGELAGSSQVISSSSSTFAVLAIGVVDGIGDLNLMLREAVSGVLAFIAIGDSGARGVGILHQVVIVQLTIRDETPRLQLCGKHSNGVAM